jgi:hypothetical protein
MLFQESTTLNRLYHVVEVDDKRSASESLMHRVNHCASSEGVNVTDSEGASSEGVTHR